MIEKFVEIKTNHNVRREKGIFFCEILNLYSITFTLLANRNDMNIQQRQKPQKLNNIHVTATTYYHVYCLQP